jgi:hypothetical protein
MYLSQNNVKKGIQSGNFTIMKRRKTFPKTLFKMFLKLNVKTSLKPIIAMNTNRYEKARLIHLFSEPANGVLYNNAKIVHINLKMNRNFVFS